MGMKAPKETDLVRDCLRLLALRGAIAIRVNSGGLCAEHGGKRRFMRFNDTPGCSDILFCYRGIFGACECKVGKNKPTDKQQSFLDAVRRAGGAAFVIYSVQELEDALEGLNA